ncbi:hypothetical protein F385_2065 [Pantoea agglomerans 299R]|nr:hypothetical protein F385_2065 [Pantoea agglomerans 299R]
MKAVHGSIPVTRIRQADSMAHDGHDIDLAFSRITGRA